MKKITLEQKKKIIISFIKECNLYSENKIKSYRDKTYIDQMTQDKIKSWENYKDFNSHAISELKKDTLDHWFQ